MEGEFVGESAGEAERYRILIDAITDYAIYMLDPDGRIVSWNSGAERFKGYGRDEIIGQHFSRFYTPEDQARGKPAWALGQAAGQGRFEGEGWRVRKDGTRFWAHVVIDPIRDPSGVLIGYAKITRDLSERKAAEEELRRSQEQLNRLIQGVTDYAIFMLDPRGQVSSWNAGAERIKQYAAEEIIGQHFSRFYTPEDVADGLPARALAVASEEGRFEREGWRVRKDGSRFWAHVIIDAIRDDDGELVGFAKVTRDVTERMETHKALEAAREALFQSQKMEALGQLTGGVAHDFNNLLMAVLGSLELVKKRLAYDPRVTPLIDNAVQGARRGAALTQRMLAFARRQDLKVEPVNLAALARGMSEFVQRTIGPSYRVELRFPAHLPPADTDPNQLESALLNLAVNARDAMPEGGVITISGRAESGAEGDFVILAVADTGVGMDAETLARAGEPFFTTKGVGKGTGLGLAMVHGLAAQSGGRLDIHSAPGEGTTVEIRLPRSSARPADRLSDPAAADPGARSLAILAVDDDPLVLVNTAALLEDLGHRVRTVASADEALDILASPDPFDLILTDQVMPRMTGDQLLLAARRLRPTLPGVIVTGFADLSRTPARDAVLLKKPFSQSDLAHVLDRALEGQPA